MSDGIEMILGGVDDFKAAIDRLIAKADEGARQIATQGAHIIEKNAKKRAPVKTGTLRRSIRMVDVTSLGGGVWKSRTAPSVIYGRRRELGFHGMTGGSHPQNVQHDPGKPYLKPGVTDSRDELNALARDIWREVSSL